MAKFLTTRGTSSQIEDIINSAKNRLVLISPFLQLSETLFQTLKGADRRKVKITLVHGKRELKPEERSQLKQLDNLSLRFLENLHAKCFFNEEHMVITSMNLYDFSEQNNREMGVLLSTKDDGDVFRDAVKEAKLIVESSTIDNLGKHKEVSYHPRTKQKGYCIRCGIPISYDLNRPLCPDCFSEWVVWQNPYYEEHCCHTCGKPAPTSRAKPLCFSCYNKSRI